MEKDKVLDEMESINSFKSLLFVTSVGMCIYILGYRSGQKSGFNRGVKDTMEVVRVAAEIKENDKSEGR